MSDDLRTAQLAILEAAAHSDPFSKDFEALMRALGARTGQRYQLRALLDRGSWRRATQPFESIRRAILGKQPRVKEIWADDKLCPVVASNESVFSDQLSMMIEDTDPCDFDFLKRVRAEFRRDDGVAGVSWDLVARRFQLSRLERKALAFMVDGIERDAALEHERRSDRRQALDRAWTQLESRWPEIRLLLLDPCHEPR